MKIIVVLADFHINFTAAGDCMGITDTSLIR